ncbi:hypothetical protein [Promicromonospora sp. NPDC050249]|uniref:hypothetical protein n=1 Tax=Promicromonospora sp. NPDC050249 TaxID=3154743 RepID=UPI0033DF0ED8
MFSPRNSQSVLEEIGDKIPRALLVATGKARDDFEEFKSQFRSWLPGLFERDMANVIHPRLFAHLQDELEAVPGVTFVNREPHRELIVQIPDIGRTYRMRIKRHSARDRIRSYPTASDILFWSGGGAGTFDGLQSINLAVGYRWRKDLREIGEPVISYRESKGDPVWAYAIEDDLSGGVLPFTYSPVLPDLPSIDLRRASEQDGEGSTEAR